MADDRPDDEGFIGTIFETVRPFFAAQWQGVWKTFIDGIPAMLRSASDTAFVGRQDLVDTLWDWVARYMQSSGLASKEFIAAIDDYKGLPLLPGIAVAVLMMIRTIVAASNTMTDTQKMTMAQHFADAYRPGLADVSSLIQTAFIAPEKTDMVRDTLHKYGLPDDQIDALFISRYALYDINTLRTLFLRKIIDENKLYERMREMGYTDTRIQEIVQTWPLIPGPQDLIMMVAKEAFEPDMVSSLGLADEFPEEQVEWLEKQGVSKEWALKYWYAHWDQPSIQMGFDMLHRGVIDKTQLDMLMRTIEIPPFWRDKLTQIAYTPYTRVDTRRMYAEGVLSADDVLRSYLDQGYDVDKATNLTRFTVLDAMTDERDLSQSQVVGAYVDRILDRPETKQLLIDLGYTADKADFLLTSADYDSEAQIQKMRLDAIKANYLDRVIDKFKAQGELQKLNLSYKHIEALLEQWDILIRRDYSSPTKSELKAMWAASIIGELEYREELEKMGYNKRYIDWYVLLNSPKTEVI